MNIPLQTQTLLAQFLTDAGIVGSDRQNFRPVVPELVQLAYLLNPANVTNNVTQFGDSWTSTGKAFSGAQNVGPVVGQLSQVELLNNSPAGSPIFGYVDEIIVVPLTASSRHRIRLHNAAVAGFAVSAQIGSLNNIATPIAPAHEVLSGSSAASFGTIIRTVTTLVNVPYVHRFNPPIRLAPGFGVIAEDGGLNQILEVAFTWREETS